MRQQFTDLVTAGVGPVLVLVLVLGLDGNWVGHSDQDVPGGCMVLGCPHGQKLWLRLQASMWPLVAAWAMDTNTDPGCGRTTDPETV